MSFLAYVQYQELAVWRKQATISVQEEFVGKALPPDLEDSLPRNLADTFDTVRSGVRQAAENYIGLCNLLERLTKRNQGIAADHLRFSQALTTLTEASTSTYATDTNDVPLLNEGISSTAKHMSVNQSLLEDEARAWDEGALEDFKKQRDSLVSVRELFDRRDRYAKDNIPQLERRIEANENKLHNLMAGPGGKPGEQEKLEQAVRNVWLHSSFLIISIRIELTVRCRTNSQSSINTLEASSSKNVYETSLFFSSRLSIILVACIRIGAKNVSNMPSCRQITGGG